MPVTQVHAAPHRNQYNALGINSGTTIFFVGPSSFAASGPLTQLKKYRCPIQMIPAKTCIHRNIASKPSINPPVCVVDIGPRGTRRPFPKGGSLPYPYCLL